jgi:hypothetical protein
MLLDTLLIPQADVLWDVARVPEAIHRGLTTPVTIGQFIGAKGPRQGLYYTQAARVLGLVDDDDTRETVVLTTYGRAFVQYDRTSKHQALRRLIRQREPTRSVFETLKRRGHLNWDDIAGILSGLAPLARSTALRRARTAAAWLCAVNLAAWQDDGRLHYQAPQLSLSYRRN